MIIWIFNLIAILTVIVSLYDFKTGLALSLGEQLLIPSYVRFIIGPLSVGYYHFLLIGLLLTFFIKQGWKYNGQKIQIPKLLLIYIVITFFSSFILIFLSTKTPIVYQLSKLLSHTFIQIGFLLLGYYTLPFINASRFLKIFFIYLILLGVYGVFCYVTSTNLYSLALTLQYYEGGEEMVNFYFEEERGGLLGRVSGTWAHPLQWGQIWNILVAFYFIAREYVKKAIYWDLLIIPLGVLNIVFSGSRTAIVACLFTIAFWLYANGAKKVLCIILPKLLILMLPLFFYMAKSETFSQLFSYIETGIFFWDNSKSEAAEIKGSSTDMRMEQLSESIHFAINNVGGLGYSGISYFGTENVGKDMRGFESVIFRRLFEQGFLGLIFFFITYYLLYKESKFAQQYKMRKRLVVGYFATYLVSIVLTGIQSTWLLFTLLPALFVSPSHIIPCNK